MPENEDQVRYWERNWVPNKLNYVFKHDFEKLIKQLIRIKRKKNEMPKGKRNNPGTNVS
jgi:hypothetical protein